MPDQIDVPVELVATELPATTALPNGSASAPIQLEAAGPASTLFTLSGSVDAGVVPAAEAPGKYLAMAGNLQVSVQLDATYLSAILYTLAGSLTTPFELTGLATPRWYPLERPSVDAVGWVMSGGIAIARAGFWGDDPLPAPSVSLLTGEEYYVYYLLARPDAAGNYTSPFEAAFLTYPGTQTAASGSRPAGAELFVLVYHRTASGTFGYWPAGQEPVQPPSFYVPPMPTYPPNLVTTYGPWVQPDDKAAVVGATAILTCQYQLMSDITGPPGPLKFPNTYDRWAVNVSNGSSYSITIRGADMRYDGHLQQFSISSGTGHVQRLSGLLGWKVTDAAYPREVPPTNFDAAAVEYDAMAGTRVGSCPPVLRGRWFATNLGSWGTWPHLLRIGIPEPEAYSIVNGQLLRSDGGGSTGFVTSKPSWAEDHYGEVLFETRSAWHEPVQQGGGDATYDNTGHGPIELETRCPTKTVS